MPIAHGLMEAPHRTNNKIFLQKKSIFIFFFHNSVVTDSQLQPETVTFLDQLLLTVNVSGENSSTWAALVGPKSFTSTTNLAAYHI